MRRILPATAALLVLGLGLAAAQNITKSVQLSQDPTGPIGFDTNSNVYFPAHVLNKAPLGPTLANGLVSSVVTGTDFQGIISGTINAASPGGLIFRQAYLAQPSCVAVSTNSSTSPIAYNTTTTGINFTTFTGQTVVHYICVGQK